MQYGIYCTVGTFDPPTQHATSNNNAPLKCETALNYKQMGLQKQLMDTDKESVLTITYQGLILKFWKSSNALNLHINICYPNQIYRGKKSIEKIVDWNFTEVIGYNKNSVLQY